MNTDIITRTINRKSVIGTLVIENGCYSYDYPQNREIAKKLLRGDKQKIAKTMNLSIGYVKLVLAGKRFNELILIEAQRIADMNVDNNWV